MNKLNQKDDSSDVCDEQQDEVVDAGDLEQSFMQTCEGLAGSKKKHSHQLQIPNAIQMMFILFSFYQDELTEIGIDKNCKVKISLNKIKISSDNQKQDVDKCFLRVAKYLQTISYTQFKHQNAYKISCSPYFNKKAEEKGFRLCRFNGKIYCHGRMSKKNLQAHMKDVFSGQYIFTVDIKSSKSKERQIYNHLRLFLRTIMKFMSKQFKDRDVKVELDTFEIKVNCIGEVQRDLVFAKNTFKNLLESVVIMIINIQNDGELDKKLEQLKVYVSKKSQYPIHVSKLSKKSITIISKQNVMRKLIQRPKVCELIQLNGKTEIGLFLPRRYNYIERKIMIEEICTKKGYDFTTLGGFYHYFKKMFIHEDEQVDQKELLELITEVMVSIKQNKDKYQIPEKVVNKKKQYKDIQVNEGEYYSTGDIKLDENLSKILKNDVLVEKLKMSKPAFVKYKVFEGEQIDKLYWYIDSQQKKVICKTEDMKEGTQYFSGKAKKMGQQYIYSFESKIKIM